MLGELVTEEGEGPLAEAMERADGRFGIEETVAPHRNQRPRRRARHKGVEAHAARPRDALRDTPMLSPIRPATIFPLCDFCALTPPQRH